MTTYVPFAPPYGAQFQFQPTLDGNQYNLQVPWNLSGQRWYFNLFDLYNNLILSKALVGSPLDKDINLLFGYFSASTMVFRQVTQQFEIGP